ncbi:MAG TPA: methylaspartate mutase [candidate division WOR-3 bacterium]|uniref:Methylaspartate mutase n=1 Tax=candidate division WOR-3 bacterium TaxID=2052148 RepID=A0A7C0VDF3_UNCW3|nr:methylaspartate mutase [candidate division WOR-3 bacterium]
MNTKKDLKRILATDCGSTTTKAILIEKKGEEYRLVVRGEAPTTVEAPFEDVTKGVLNAIREVEELTGVEILDGEKIIKPAQDKRGVDIYVSTSSAGGGLQMMVAGVVKQMTAESAARAALGAGAIVMDVIATNDKRMDHERIELIRRLRPDMILLSGGVDGGTISHVVHLAELIAAAEPKPRFGTGYDLPVIYAGNKDAREEIKKILEKKSALSIVDNLRPVLERENLKPARDKIHDLFMEHVMAHAPGYRKLMTWTDVPIMPTPGAVGLLIETVARKENIEVLGVDIGGATTDIFSVFQGVFNRTVSANLGMSYSISNVLAETGIPNIMRWVPFTIDEVELRNRIRNKMIRPTTIPQTLEELMIEQAIAREALRLALLQHKEMAVGLKGVQQERTISDAFAQTATGETLVNMMTLNLVVGSGGALSHAPRRVQSALMMIDAFEVQGITRLAVDSIFMMPHLGVLSTVHERSATEVFEKDCLIRLGTSIVPVGTSAKEGQVVVTVNIGDKTYQVKYGEMKLIPLGLGETVEAEIIPAKGFDVGAGKGKPVTTKLEGGVVGIIIDGRGRPLTLPEDHGKRIAKLKEWFTELEVYPSIP